MKTSNSILKKLIPGLLLGLLVMILITLFGDLKSVSLTMLSFQWKYFPLALAFTLINYTLRFLKWHYYLKRIGASQIPWKTSLRMFVAGFPLAVTPGKAGEVLKGLWIQQAGGAPIAKGVSVVVAERISDGLAVLALSTLGVIAYPRYWYAFMIILAGLLSVIIISQIRPLAYLLLDGMDKLPLIRRISHLLREFYEGSFTLFNPGATLLAVGLGTISWLGEGIGFYFLLVGLGFTPSPALAGEAVFILAFSTVIGAVSALPGGLGATEASIAGMLSFILQSIPSQAAAATLLIRLATLWFGVFLGLITWTFSLDLIGLKTGNSVK
ncbi:MAG TPA: lysylphosphatidylglycerol synthase transmembrane domain-containing protein [Anaerolineaceae bacterium]